MTKAIMISVNPKHALNILQGKKTLELRKSVPKDFVGWVYMYVTKNGDKLRNQFFNGVRAFDLVEQHESDNIKLNGSIVARWWHDEYDTIDKWDLYNYYDDMDYGNKHKERFSKLEKDSCLLFKNIYEYSNAPYQDLYAWHIKNLEIFDKQMKLNQFYSTKPMILHTSDCIDYKWYPEYDTWLKYAGVPQSWQYVWVNL